ncbi:MAG: hypothetical protein AAF726_13135 [Planctomycetota bacterium]
MLTQRFLCLVVAWALLGVVASRLAGEFDVLLDPSVLSLVLVVPWIAVLASHGPREALETLTDVIDETPAAIPVERRSISAAALRTASSASVAVGLLLLLTSVLRTLVVVTATPGSASTDEIMLGMGSGLLAPVYGLAVSTLLYGPCSAALEAAGQEP